MRGGRLQISTNQTNLWWDVQPVALFCLLELNKKNSPDFYYIELRDPLHLNQSDSFDIFFISFALLSNNSILR